MGTVKFRNKGIARPRRITVQFVAVTMSLLLLVSAGVADDKAWEIPVSDGPEDDSAGWIDTLPDIVTTIAEDSGLSVFLKLLKCSGMDLILSGKGPFTVFSPVDSAFNSLNQVRMDSLMADTVELKAMLARHIVPDRRLIFLSTGKIRVTTLDGEELAVIVDEEMVSVAGANVIDEELECSNGVLHVVDALLNPKKQKRRQ